MVFQIVPSVLGKRGLRELYPLARKSPLLIDSRIRVFSTINSRFDRKDGTSPSDVPASEGSDRSSTPSTFGASSDTSRSIHDEWEHNPDLNIKKFSELPGENFGVNQHMIINDEFKEALRQILWKFRAPIRYAFAYGSGVFPQSTASTSSTTSSLHPAPPEAIQKVQGGNQKVIDFVFGVSYSQHWHSLNIQEHRDHYSSFASLGSYAVSKLQDSFGAGCYYNPYITVNGTVIKYGVVNIDTLCRDLSEWDTLYLAGRLQKPVKILRDNPSVRLANQVNLLSAVRTALLLLPEHFTEHELYTTIAGISYMGDPRMRMGGEDLSKVANIVRHQISNFRRLYAPFIDNLPNIQFKDPIPNNTDWLEDPTVNSRLTQNMDHVTRGHMVRRLPTKFREKLYFEYQSKFKIPRGEFNEMLAKTKDEDPDRIRRRIGGPFEQRIASDHEGGGLREEVKQVIEKTIRWPSFTQGLKGVITAGAARSWRYASEKRQKARIGAELKASEKKGGEKPEEKEKEKNE